ncbi:hypothetical protein [Desulfoluna butyratoxydans]|uniref:Beta-hydroxydecanoyl thiol ester dehydrase faba/fabz n=1 Tax=Desulfoluna butyratoxydans TaxID=231438 RepID=A0A4U8YH93_9BACT|nr:hypothetical protein [Desulfoluna butyratoxydans]VFQ42891.1 beta-hydroxydecanoyl thiol ester dehydrase faba/fabz [Desulfoluna butyratoxydans]
MEAVLSGLFRFDGSDPLYKGHFPGNPVVPGSLVVEAFYHRLRDEGHAPVAAKNFRFRVFVPPGEYRYTVRCEKGRATCTLFTDEAPAVTGEMVLP